MKKTVVRKARSLDGVKRKNKVLKPEPTKTQLPNATREKNEAKPIPPTPQSTSYTLLNPVEEGSYGHVSRARDLNGAIIAVKRLKNTCPSEGVPTNAIREIRALQSLRHENIIGLIRVEPEPLSLILEFAEHDLKELGEAFSTPFSFSAIKRVVQDILLAVDFMHTNDIMHRDLKPANVLYTNKGVTKLADFGLARLIDRKGVGSDDKSQQTPQSPEYTREVVSLWYRAPEILRGDLYDESVDEWASGCLAMELINHKVFLKGSSELDQLRLSNEVEARVKEMENGQVKDFAAAAMIDRWDAHKLLGHWFFTEDPIPKERMLMPTFPSRANGERTR